MKRVLVTGATEFIGRHSLEPLARRGYEGNARLPDGSAAGADGPARRLARSGPAPRRDARGAAGPGKADPPAALCLVRRARAVLDVAGELPVGAGEPSLVSAFAEEGGQRVVMAGTCAEYRLELWLLLGRGNTPGAGNPVRRLQALAPGTAGELRGAGRPLQRLGPHLPRVRSARASAAVRGLGHRIPSTGTPGTVLAR